MTLILPALALLLQTAPAKDPAASILDWMKTRNARYGELSLEI